MMAGWNCNYQSGVDGTMASKSAGDYHQNNQSGVESGKSTGKAKSGGRKKRSKSAGVSSTRRNAGHGY